MLDSLFQSSKQFRSSEKYWGLMNYCSHFWQLGMYNAAFVQVQKPESRFVLTAYKWNKLGRMIKGNARPIVILQPFGPILLVFDIGDTCWKDNDNGTLRPGEKDYLDRLEQPYKAIAHRPVGEALGSLYYSLNYYGIAKDLAFQAGSSYGAQIRADNNQTVDVPVKFEPYKITIPSLFLISVNSNHDDNTKFASICHELGHLFCRHLSCGWWPVRNLPHDLKEFEAESVSWLVCTRHGLVSPSERYLCGYLDKYGETPEGISYESILVAVGKIEAMIQRTISTKILLDNDPEFKRLYDSYKQNAKAK